jgi:hypothetical protein
MIIFEADTLLISNYRNKTIEFQIAQLLADPFKMSDLFPGG